MFTVEEMFFCKEVILYPDDSRISFGKHFSRIKAGIYPHDLTFIVAYTVVHSGPFQGDLMIQILRRDGQHIYESNIRPVSANAPPRPKQKLGVYTTLEHVKFPEPGKYFVEIVFNDRVRHQKSLFME